MFLAGHPSQGCFGLQSHCAPCYFFNQASFYPSDFSFKCLKKKKLNLQEVLDLLQNQPSEISDVLTDDFSDEVPANNLLEFLLNFEDGDQEAEKDSRVGYVHCHSSLSLLFRVEQSTLLSRLANSARQKNLHGKLPRWTLETLSTRPESLPEPDEIGNLIEEVVDLARKLNSEVDNDDVQE
ncbi:hypothetical protein TNCV_1266521 [Trichonephila clavipes]|nr:hypothetical protein TNCV_1266521 [Trichonephila clavipes]